MVLGARHRVVSNVLLPGGAPRVFFVISSRRVLILDSLRSVIETVVVRIAVHFIDVDDLHGFFVCERRRNIRVVILRIRRLHHGVRRSRDLGWRLVLVHFRMGQRCAESII